MSITSNPHEDDRHHLRQKVWLAVHAPQTLSLTSVETHATTVVSLFVNTYARYEHMETKLERDEMYEK